MNEEPQDKNVKHDDQDAREPAVKIPSDFPTHEHEFARLKEERDQLEQKLQRAMADLANVRRRQRQEIDDSRRRVLEGLTQEILPVLDTFGMALDAYGAQSTDTGADAADPKALVEGVRLVRTMLSGVLEHHGLQEIRSSGPFDPNQHEAMAMEPSDDVPEGHILRVMLTGYLLGDRIVRHSRVVVSGMPAIEDDRPAED